MEKKDAVLSGKFLMVLEGTELMLGPGDCVLVKGSRAMGLEVIAEAVAVVPARA